MNQTHGIPQLGPDAIPGSQLFVAIPQTMPAAPQEAKSSFEVGMLIAAFKRCWLAAILIGTALGSIAALVVWQVMPKTYTSSVEFLVQPNLNILYSSETTGESVVDLETYKDTLKRKAKYPEVLRTALETEDVKRCATIKKAVDPEKWLRDHIQITSPSTEFLQFSLTGQNPVDVSKIVGAFGEAFIKVVVDEEQNREAKQLEEQKRILKTAEMDLKIDLEKLTEMDRRFALSTEQANVFFERTTTRMLGFEEKIGELDMRILENRFVLDAMKSELEKLKQKEATETARPPKVELPKEAPAPPKPTFTIEDEFVEQQLKQDPEYQRLFRAVSLLETSIAVLEKKVRKDHPDLLRKQREIEAAQKELENFEIAQMPIKRKEVMEAIEVNFQQRYAEEQALAAAQATSDPTKPPLTPAMTIELMETQLRSMEQLKVRYQDQIGDLEREDQQRISDLVDREQTAEKVETLREKVRFLTARVDAREVELNNTRKAVEKARDAVVANSADIDSRIKLSAMAGAGLLGLIVVLMVWREHVRRRVSSAAELNGSVGLSLIGTVPVIPRSVSNRSRKKGDNRNDFWHNALAESFDAARTMLLRNADLHSVRTVMIASAVGGEGKTTLCCHLATSLARSNRRTLIIDGDLRRPSVHKVFNIENKGGVCEIVRGTSTLEEVCQEVLPNLHVLSAGKVSQDVLNSLSQQPIQELLEKVRNMYDFVIVDSSPILPVTDGLLISQHCDGVLFSVRRDVSQVHKVAESVERFRMLGVRIIGAVAIGLDSASGYGRSYPYSRYDAGYSYTGSVQRN